MAKKRLFLWIGSAFVVCLVYLFVAPKPILPELTLNIQWILDLSQPVPDQIQSSDTVTEGIPFVLGTQFGYISANGHLLANRSLQKNQMVSITPSLLSIYTTNPDSVTITNQQNKKEILINNPGGYPLLFGDSSFIIGKDQDSISAIKDDGSVQWKYFFPSPITAIDYKAKKLLIGTLDGSIYVLGPEGDTLFTFQPGGSRLSVIVGAALSSDGNKIALISGIDKQRFILLEKSSQTYKVLDHYFLNSDFRRPVLIKFIQDNQYILFEGENSFFAFDSVKQKMHVISLEAPLIAIEELKKDQTLFILAGGDTKKQLIVFKLPDRKLVTSSFTARDSFLVPVDNQILLGSDTVIVSLSMPKQD